MPYDWTPTAPGSSSGELHLWPHQSLPPRGLAAVVLGIFTLALIPLFTMLGSVLLWGILPFVLLAVLGTWFALSRNQRDRRIIEVLTLTENDARLVRRNPNGDIQEWQCNRFWVTPVMHEHDGPVPHYVTLRGSGREVEIGAFLSEDERVALYDELIGALRGPAAA
jgi:uncharacterized membrane protein